MKQKLKWTCYLANAIEHANKNSQDWKILFKTDLKNPLFGIYDPIEQEAKKTGKSVEKTGECIIGLKKGGHWNLFDNELDKIWWGNTVPVVGNKIRMLQLFRDRASIDGNHIEEFGVWGDYEAVARSTFIVVFLEKNIKTVGTYFETHTAYLLDVPIYLILPDQIKVDTNSTLLRAIRSVNGEVFYNVKDCCKFIKETYNIRNES